MPPESKPVFVPPKPEIGDLVVYYQDCNWAQPLPAIVTGIGLVGLSLAALVPGVHGIMPVANARHRQDPALVNVDVQNEGAWEFGPRAFNLAGLFNRVRELEGVAEEQSRRIKELQDAVKAIDAVVKKK
jgi:hypothetical protein